MKYTPFMNILMVLFEKKLMKLKNRKHTNGVLMINVD